MSELFLKLLNMSITASWLIVAVVVLRLVLKKAPKWINCVLWALVAVRLICPFSFESKVSLVPDVQPMPQAAEEYQVQLPPEGAVTVYPNIDGTTDPDAAIVVTSESGLVIDVADIAAAVWLAGMVVLLLYAAISYLRLRRRVSAAMPIGNKVWFCDAVESPFILGFFRPRIYLPSGIAEGDMEHVLAHEQAHLKRRDHWWKPLGYVLLAVYWFNPLIWVAYILLCRDIELACDEKVINRPDTDRKAYSEALLACSVKRSAITACPLAFGEVSVRGRIKSVLNYKKPAFWIILVALVACIVVAVCFLTDPVGQEAEEQGSISATSGADESEVIPVTSELDESSPALEEAMDHVSSRIAMLNDKWKTIAPGNWITEGRVTAFECVASIAMENIRVELYRLEYRMLLDGNVNAVLVGGMSHEEIDGKVWLTEWESSGQPYLLHYSASRDGQIDWAMTTTEEIGMIYAENKDMETELGLDKYTIAAQKLYEKYLKNVSNDAAVDYSILNGTAEFFNQPLEITEDPMTYQERLDWVKSGTVYTETLENGGETSSVSLGQWKEGDGCLAYVWQFYGSLHPGVCCLTIRFKDGTQARLPLPDEQTYRTAKPTSMEFQNGKFVYDVQLDSEWPEDESIQKRVYHYELDLTKKTLSLSLSLTESTANSTVADAMVAAVETLLEEELPATISMTGAGRFHPILGRVDHVFDAWDSINGKNSCRGILDHTYQEVDSLETSDILITLEFTVNGVDWGLTFYEGTDSLSVWTDGAEYYFKAIPNQEDIFLSPLGSLIRRWYDEAEYMALDGYDGKTLVVPNTGQSYLEAAQAWCEAYESLHLMASPGSKECYSYVSCRVEAAEGATNMYREQGEIGENTYAFYAYTAFVPENEQALQWSMAGNTGAYEGDDPNVPKEAYEYTRCGYITLEEDGWHGVIVGTGW